MNVRTEINYFKTKQKKVSLKGLVELQNKKILVRLFYVFHSFVYCAVDLAYYLLEEDPGQHNSILYA